MSLRALKTDEEIAAVPLGQPILVELPGGVSDLSGDDDAGKKAEPVVEDSGAKALQGQLEAMQAAQRASDARAEKAERDAAQARREAEEATQRATALEGDVITGGLSAAQAELAAAKRELVRSGESGDFEAQADAQARIGRASAQIVNLEGGAAEVAERIEKKPPQVQQHQERQNPDPIAGIDANPNLFPAEKAWLKAHPDSVTDTKRNNELGVGYERAMKQGLTRGTPDYFAFLEDFMGYAKTSSDTNHDGSTSVQAPVSRQERGGDGRPTGNKIQLDPEERMLASNMGISETEYARNKQRMQADMKANPEKYGVR